MQLVHLIVSGLVQGHSQLREIFLKIGILALVEKFHKVIKLLMLDRIIRMRVTLHAAETHAHERFPCGIHAIHHGGNAELFVIGSTLAVDLGETTEGGGDFLFERGVRNLIARDLFDGELVEGKIFVEGVDQPIAVFPVVAASVVGVTHGVRIAREIQPNRSPAFTEAR